MSNILNSNDFGLKIYNKFPPKYREDDIEQNFALKRYVEALSDGGFKHSIDEINGITHLIDPDKADAKVLSILFKQYGLEVFHGIPEEYLRYLLPRLGEAWAKKGSISVIEFVTSALSGTKASTNVTYDKMDNPIIEVKLEMDYSLSDYIPDAKQFTRLLGNFVPFYCDMNLIYSYLFYETQVLRTQDTGDVLNIFDHREEKGFIPFSSGRRQYPQIGTEKRKLNTTLRLNELFTVDTEPDHIEDTIKYVLKEKGSFDRRKSHTHFKPMLNTGCTLNNLLTLSEYVDTDWNTDKIGLIPINETSVVKPVVTLTDKTLVMYNESTGLWSKGRKIENNAVLGEAVLGESVFATYNDYADIVEDKVTQNLVSFGNLGQPVDAHTNNQYNTLNSSFYLNGIHCYDIIITKNGEKSAILHQ